MGGYPEASEQRAMTMQEVILRAMSGKIRWLDAAEILRIRPRTMRRWRWRYEVYGFDGLYDRRKRAPSPRRVPLAEVETVLKLYRERYEGWNVKHFHEQLKEEHQIEWSYTWVKTALQGAGLVAKQQKRTAHRTRRERRPMPGMMLFIDGSRHEWVEGRQNDLMLMLDDANNEVYWAELVEEEDTRSTLRAVRGVIEKQGLFCSLYTDRGSHFFHTPKADGPVDKHRLTQVGRVLKQLGIEHIPSYSPEARGRIERMFQTWQGRLPQELKLRGIKDPGAANAYIQRHFIGRMNRSFSRKAVEEGSAFVPCRAGNLDELFSLQTERVVNRDNTIQHEGRVLQITAVRWRSSLAKCVVKVCEQMDGKLVIRYGPHVVATFEGGKEDKYAA